MVFLVSKLLQKRRLKKAIQHSLRPDQLFQDVEHGFLPEEQDSNFRRRSWMDDIDAMEANMSASELADLHEMQLAEYRARVLQHYADNSTQSGTPTNAELTRARKSFATMQSASSFYSTPMTIRTKGKTFSQYLAEKPLPELFDATKETTQVTQSSVQNLQHNAAEAARAGLVIGESPEPKNSKNPLAQYLCKNKAAGQKEATTVLGDAAPSKMILSPVPEHCSTPGSAEHLTAGEGLPAEESITPKQYATWPSYSPASMTGHCQSDSPLYSPPSSSTLEREWAARMMEAEKNMPDSPLMPLSPLISHEDWLRQQCELIATPRGITAVGSCSIGFHIPGNLLNQDPEQPRPFMLLTQARIDEAKARKENSTKVDSPKEVSPTPPPHWFQDPAQVRACQEKIQEDLVRASLDDSYSPESYSPPTPWQFKFHPIRTEKLTAPHPKRTTSLADKPLKKSASTAGNSSNNSASASKTLKHSTSTPTQGGWGGPFPSTSERSGAQAICPLVGEVPTNTASTTSSPKVTSPALTPSSDSFGSANSATEFALDRKRKHRAQALQALDRLEGKTESPRPLHCPDWYMGRTEGPRQLHSPDWYRRVQLEQEDMIEGHKDMNPAPKRLRRMDVEAATILELPVCKSIKRMRA
jgi:hypothetical protein